MLPPHCAHALLQTHLIGKKGVGAPVAQVVSSHMALNNSNKSNTSWALIYLL